MLAIWSLVPLPFLNPACTSGNPQFLYCWSLAWRILNITLLSCEMGTLCGSLNILWHWPSLGLEWKLTFSRSVATAKFSKLIVSSFRILNSSAGIPWIPLALLVVILPKAHLTLHARMSGSRWVTTPSWLSGSLRPFLYSSVYFCHFFLVSSASVRSVYT